MKTVIGKCLVVVLVLVLLDTVWGQTPVPRDLEPIGQLVPIPVQGPFDTPANCYPSSITNPAYFVDYDDTKTSASRTLKRVLYQNTTIETQTPSSQQWVTRCPVQIDPQHIYSSACNPREVFNYGDLFITDSGAGLIFKIDTALGTFRGNLIRASNPHGSNTHILNRHINPEIAWLRSTNVILLGAGDNEVNYEFYIFLQNKVGKKHFLVEAFDLTDAGCLATHRPSQSTLCMNDHSPSAPGNCVLPPQAHPNTLQEVRQGSSGPGYPDDTALANKLVSEPAVSKLSESNQGYREVFTIKSPGLNGKRDQSQIDPPIPVHYGLQTDSGGGHEPIEH